MPASRSRFRLVAAAGLAALALALLALHLRYPLPYVYRVMAYRDADFEDIHRFPARLVAAPEAPSRLSEALDPGLPALFEEHPDIESFDRWLDETETTALLVVHRGRLVAERYLRGYDRSSLQNSFSISKSVTSALVGVAVRDGLVEASAPVTRYLPELARRDQRFDRITVAQLLDMVSGIRYSSEVEFPFFTADNPLIYYHPDLESVLLERTVVASPPGGFQYNNFNPPLLGLVLRRATGLDVAGYLERELWRPLGAEAAAGWTVDDRGFERMESGFHARARDLARFGQLYLDGGMAAGRRLLPEAWIERTTELDEPAELDRWDGRSWGYRGGWWIVPRRDGRSDYCAIGRYGQFVYVSPRHRTVFVRTGPGRGEWGDRDWTELFYSVAAGLSVRAEPGTEARPAAARASAVG